MPPMPKRMPTSTPLAAEQARLEAIIATAAPTPHTRWRIAADALRLPPWDA